MGKVLAGRCRWDTRGLGVAARHLRSQNTENAGSTNQPAFIKATVLATFQNDELQLPRYYSTIKVVGCPILVSLLRQRALHWTTHVFLMFSLFRFYTRHWVCIRTISSSSYRPTATIAHFHLCSEEGSCDLLEPKACLKQYSRTGKIANTSWPRVYSNHMVVSKSIGRGVLSKEGASWHIFIRRRTWRSKVLV